MTPTYPNVDIKYCRFLAPFFNYYTKHEIHKDNPEWEPPTVEEVNGRIKKLQAAWKEEERTILEGMQEALQLSFFENRIPAYIVPARKGAFSDPIVISSGLPPEKFVNTLTHELIHRLSTQNNENISPADIVREMYPDIDNFLVTNHILVHTVHAYIYREVRDREDELQAEIKFLKDNNVTAYVHAWEIVERDGYKNILEQIKERY